MSDKLNTRALVLLTFFSSALFSIITPMAKELSIALSLGGEEQVARINSMFFNGWGIQLTCLGIFWR